MTDELSIQQGQVQRANPLPYALGGALLGTGVGYAGARYTTEPKYKSYEDIIKDTEDSFKKNVEEVYEEQTARDKAIAARNAGADAAKNYDAELEKAKAANVASATPELPADHDLMKQKSTLSEQITSLEGKTGKKEVTKEPMTLLRQKLKALRKAEEELATLKESNAPKEAIDAAKARLESCNKGIQSTIDKIVAATSFKDTKLVDGVEVKVADSEIEKMRKAFKSELQGYQQDYMRAYDAFSVKQLANEYLKAKGGVATEKQLIEDTLKNLKQLTGYEFGTDTARRLKTKLKAEKNKNAQLKSVLKDLKDAHSMGSTTSILDRLTWLFTGKDLPKNDPEKAMQLFLDTLTDKEKKLFQTFDKDGKPITKPITEETINELIKSSDEKLAALKAAPKTINDANKAITKYKRTMNDELAKIRRTHGAEAYVDKDGVICKKGKPVGQPAAFTPPKFDAKGTELPKNVTLVEGATEADVKALEEARTKLTDIEKQITEAREKLPKGELKTDAEIIKEVETKLGGTKEELIKKAETQGKDDLAKLLERKIPNKKLALWLAGGAVALGTLGYVFAPKNHEA